MFQFTTETIVNSTVDSPGVPKFGSNNSTFSVLRAGNFKKSEVISLYKHPASESVKEVYNATIPQVTAGVTYRLAIDARLSGSINSDWANDFVHRSKLFYYEYTALTNSGADLATAFKAIIAKEMNMTGFTHFKFTNAGDIFTLTASNEYIRFKSVEVQALTEVGITGATLTGYNNYTLLALTNVSKINGAQGFGTTTWLTKNLRLPTIDRTNYTAIGQDELPQAGSKYNQYSIRIATNRGFSGMGAVGETLTSVTTHVFYVLDGIDSTDSNVASAFETAMAAAGLTDLITISGNVGLVIQGDSAITKPGTGTSTTQYTVTGASGAVTWTASTLPGVTIAFTTGILSVTSIATSGTSTITATDAGTGKATTFAVIIA